MIFLQFQEIWGRDCTYGFTVNIPDLGMANLNSFEITTLKNNITIETNNKVRMYCYFAYTYDSNQFFTTLHNTSSNYPTYWAPTKH